ncbi:MAG TPA: sugar ABC transporter permease [Anaerolineaceae bacterium]|nr:sugar ABC transporter permease [Anaerolineaceae bacterium]HPN54182.1 sugar ABC transporter permease [Anaerolineaceae bacterium]
MTAAVTRKHRFSLTPYLFILPHLIFFAVFIGYPFFSGLYISFFQYDVLRPEATVFVGLQNYLDLFKAGSVKFIEFWNSMQVTLTFVIFSVPFLVVIPLVLAVLLNIKVPGRNFFRAVYFAPWVLSCAVISLIWWWIFQSQGGLLNYYLKMLGLETPRWLSTMPYAMISIIIATVWWTMGYNMIIFLAALQDIPTDLYEAAEMDGAGSWARFVHVTLPLLRPVLVFIVITTIIASFNLLGQPMMMTRGAPAQPTGGGATEPVMLRIFTEGFVRPFQGSAAAMSVVVATIMVIFSFANFRIFRQRD